MQSGENFAILREVLPSHFRFCAVRGCLLSRLFSATYDRDCFPRGSAGKEATCNVADLGSIPGLGRSPAEGNGYLLLENSMDSLARGVTKSRTRLSSFHSLTRDSDHQGSPGGSVVKNSPPNEGDLDSVPGWGRSPGEGNGNPLQYSCPENPLAGELGLQSRTRLKRLSNSSSSSSRKLMYSTGSSARFSVMT